MSNLERLQNLLRELFQLDLADLDFGLYRLLHLKRAEVEAFLTEQLPRQVDEAFQSVAAADRAALEKDIQDRAAKIREDVAEDAITPTGEPNPAYANIKSVQHYQTLREKLAAVEATEARKAEVFNHLYNFFSRYYEDGDFIPRRRYGARESYAVPYDGQEVFFHWANRDQHYVKSAETLKDYAFNVETVAGRYRVRFALTEASVPKDNTKGDYRFFFPRPDLAAYDEAAREFRLPFEYRLPTEKEAAKYGTNAKGQEALSAGAVPAILKAVPDETLRTSLVADQRTEAERKNDTPELPLLLKRLRHFTKRQTTDFFIHKDLRGFLRRELEFYVKDQVLNLADLEGDLDAKRRMIRVLRRLGEQVIEFLAQFEDAQKRLFEKKKFVIETQYCITVGNINEGFYPEIAACEAQWQEWKDLFHIDEKEKNLFNAGAKGKKDRRVAFLKAHPTLVLDTKHFDQEFRDRLPADFGDLDDKTDGLLIHSENFQALNLLLEKYRDRVQCIHIDPPYNTQTSGFLYKNDYQHSSWLAMMQNRVGAGVPLLSVDGAYLCHIDENEYELLHVMFRGLGIPDGGTIVWNKKNPMLGREGIATQHEYVLWRTRCDLPVYVKPTNVLMIIDKAQSIIQKHGGVNEEARKEFAVWIAKCDGLSGGDRAYRFIDDDGRIYQSVAMGAPEPRTDPKFHVPLVHPVTKKKCPVPSYGWSRTPENLQELIARGEIIFGQDETVQPRKKVFLTNASKRQLSSVISDSSRGKNDVDNLGVEFPYCHPVSLYEQLLGAGASSDRDIVLDYFAGSGTTGHAVINLNREDGMRRSFILVEMADYFDTVLLPRIKKVTFSPEWKEGKPVRQATAEEAERSPRIVKYIRLESYEDALHNIATDAVQERAAAREAAHKAVVGEDEYRLKYLVRLPLEAADTMLSVAQLAHPFDYTLEVLTDDGPCRRMVDLVETFNCLYGLRVRKLATWVNGDDKTAKEKDGRAYRVIRATDREKRRRILVLWRDMTDPRPEVERAFLEGKLKEEGQTYDQVLINGDTATPGVESLDPLFKRLMMAEEGAAE